MKLDVLKKLPFGSIIKQTKSTREFAKGKKSGDKYLKDTACNCAEAGGSILGAEAGAAIGTMLCPGPGTVIGGIVGGTVGGKVASKTTEKVYGDV